MTFTRNKLLLPLCVFLSITSVMASANIAFEQNQVEVIFPPTCNHIPISLPYTLTQSDFDESLITVSSSSDWAIASVNTELDRIEVVFDSQDLIASYTATVEVTHGGATTELFVQAVVPPLDVYRLVDDPLGPLTYGIQKNGIDNGSIFAFDSIQETMVSCVTVGKDPSDFVLDAENDELLVLNSIDQTIDIIDLNAFTVKETLNLPVYNDWGGSGETSGNIDLGANGIIYYTDGAWGPVLRVFDRNTEQVLQSITFYGGTPSNTTGFMDFAVTNDKTTLLAMPQYGWSAGSHSSVVGQFDINADGTVSVNQTPSVESFAREPFEAPVLISNDDQIVVMKTIAAAADDVSSTMATFPSAIWSMAPNGSVVATQNSLYELETGNELYTFLSANFYNFDYVYSVAQAFTSDYGRFIYFDSSSRSLKVVDLITEIGLALLGQTLQPANGSIVSNIDSLDWTPLSGVFEYDVYLGTNADDVTNANTSSSLYLGRVTSASYQLLQTLVNGTEYYWRVDPVSASGPQAGDIYSFIVSPIALDITDIDVSTVSGHANYEVDIQLSSQQDGLTWSASSEAQWISFIENTGTTPATLKVSIDTRLLPVGRNTSSITLTLADGSLQIPVNLEVDPLNLTHIRSDRHSSTMYAISEAAMGSNTPAYLLEIDSTSETIERVIIAGYSVTDMAIHYADNLLYVANWSSGELRAINKDTLELEKIIPFEPAGATGYSQDDVFRVAAGVSERIVVEEEDQWVDISLINTNTEAELAQSNVREGGGAFGPTGRYYYHGENNSSGAAIIKYDTSGDTFTQLVRTRPADMISYYGSRTVLVSEDGSRVFWAGAVFDADLEPEWEVGTSIYSSSQDGRYAFGSEAIYDINLRRQVLSMPTTTSVSGFNSSTEKLLIQQNLGIKFYSISPQADMPAPILDMTDAMSTSITLTWNDDSLEMGFAIQYQALGNSTWEDLNTTDANATSWRASGLEAGKSYSFRVRAFTEDKSSAWSNVVYKQEDDFLDVLASGQNPINGSIINAPDTLSWTFIPWIAQYDLYLGTDETTVTDADTSSALYLGRIDGSSYALQQMLTNNTEYFWRIDPVVDTQPQTGRVYSFIASELIVDKPNIVGQTIVQHNNYQVTINLSSQQAGLAWAASSDASWVSFTQNSGTTPASLEITLDATQLSVGSNSTQITLTYADNELHIPITLDLEPLNITHIRSDRNSSRVYAVSEVANSVGALAYLLEIDSATELINRVVTVGASVTDIAIHYADNLLYVTNWRTGNLLVLNKDTLALEKTIMFEPAGATGYSQGDVYRVAAGVSERIVVEEEDQWVDIGLINTDTEAQLAQSYVREGGGAFGPSGRYYYHGENNSSGAAIIKYDTSGDTFTQLVRTRPADIISYFGSRTVIISEDGSRIFWAGAVLDADLASEWQTSDTIYSSSEDGRYAFAANAIFDINLKRQILSMPASIQASGFNSVSQKLIVQVNNGLGFYDIAAQQVLSAPELNLSDITENSISLSWTDNSLEMGFVIQRKIVGTDTWEEVNTLNANETQWVDYNLESNTQYEYRIQARANDNTSDWSNVGTSGTEPIANTDVIMMIELNTHEVMVAANDAGSDASLELSSITLYETPEFGQVTVLESGAIRYTPNGDFPLYDSFTYTISDTNGVVSQPGLVEVFYIPAPELSFLDQERHSVSLQWHFEAPESLDMTYSIQKRAMGTQDWEVLVLPTNHENTHMVEDLDESTIYQFRIRAVSDELQTLWSNVVHSSMAPQANADTILIAERVAYQFLITNNDTDADGSINANRIVIVSAPEFGEVLIEPEGEIRFIPNNTFAASDSFTYTVEDDSGVPSNAAVVSLTYIAPPVINASNITQNAVNLTWTDTSPDSIDVNYDVQRRKAGDSAWQTIHTTANNETTWSAANLDAQTNYEFRVSSFVAGFTSNWSNTQSVTTLAPVVTPVTTPPTQESSSGGSLGIIALFFLLSVWLSRTGPVARLH